jgi:hypothetical protein
MKPQDPELRKTIGELIEDPIWSRNPVVLKHLREAFHGSEVEGSHCTRSLIDAAIQGARQP